jgi:RNA recognition motif-containing protein
MKSLFVGNLPWSATEAELKEKFSEFGAVFSARIVTDKFTGKSRGFGFVDMDDERL